MGPKKQERHADKLILSLSNRTNQVVDTSKFLRSTHKLVSIMLAFGLSIMLVPFNGIFSSSTAEAATLDELTAQVESTSSAYKEAVSEQERLTNEINDLTTRIEELETQVPDLQEKTNTALVGMYKENDTLNALINAVLDTTSLVDAITTIDNYLTIYNYQRDLLTQLNSAKAELETSKTQLESDKAAIDETVASTKTALDEATAARQTAQAETIAASSGSDIAGDIDWSLSREEFVAEWSVRINNYLSGTPLAGYGEQFADAAYLNGADPRFSPAISRIESSCGAACFRPYNAWGWMGHSFSSWEEAIYAHVEYLAGPLYGGYLTLKGAATYCPPGTPWYNKVLTQMQKI